MAKFTGTVKRNHIEGGFWELHTSDGEHYQLRGGDEDLKVEGLKVEIEGKIDTGGFGIGMFGPILDVVSWKKCN
jgi:hypothetical protein